MALAQGYESGQMRTRLIVVKASTRKALLEPSKDGEGRLQQPSLEPQGNDSFGIS